MTKKISRRTLGLAAIGTAAYAQTEPEKKYGGALEGLANKVDLKEFDPVAWTLDRHAAAPLRMTFRANTRKQAEAWQRRLRGKLVDLLGGFPKSHSPLRPQTIEVRDFPTYRREKFVFQSRPGAAVLAYLITPGKATTPTPVVICVPGHGRGVDDIVGIDEYGKDRAAKPGYQHDFALQVAEHGMAALAMEPMAFGCRRDAITAKHGLGGSACQPAAGSALLLGETMLGWRVYDAMRAIDWIQTRPALDSQRIGCMGISGGGTCTLFAAAVEPRIRAAFMSCSLNTFRSSIMSLSHCIDNYVPGILNWAEMYDVAGLIAPRALFSEAGDGDPIFPIAASRESFTRVKKVYEVLEAPEAVGQEIFTGDHEFHGAQGLPFLAKVLGG